MPTPAPVAAPSSYAPVHVHRVLIHIVSFAANATPGLGRYPPFKREVVAIATTALEGFKNEAKKMVVALLDMERAFVPPQHFIHLVQRSENISDKVKQRHLACGYNYENLQRICSFNFFVLSFVLCD